jgi:hypothetical protein
MSLSGDASTLAVGAVYDGNNIGATWIFDSNSTLAPTISPTESPTLAPTSPVQFMQQGNKLVGTGYSGSPQQGVSSWKNKIFRNSHT